MILICIILILLLIGLLISFFKDVNKHPERYKNAATRRRKRRRSSNNLPPFTAWTWWMYAEKNSGRFPDSQERRDQLQKGR